MPRKLHPDAPPFPFEPEELGPGHWRLAGYEVKRHAVAKWKIVSNRPNGSFSNKELAFDVIKRIYFRVLWASRAIEKEREDGFLMPTEWVIHALEQRHK